jgi:hypothetical protein
LHYKEEDHGGNNNERDNAAYKISPWNGEVVSQYNKVSYTLNSFALGTTSNAIDE